MHSVGGGPCIGDGLQNGYRHSTRKFRKEHYIFVPVQARYGGVVYAKRCNEASGEKRLPGEGVEEATERMVSKRLRDRVRDERDNR